MKPSSNKFFDKFTILENDIQLERQVSPQTYCESVGRKAAIFGYEQGIFETWVYPFKIASDLQFSVSIPAYNLFVTGTEIAKQIIVRPEMPSIIFSHDLFTIRWHLLTPLNDPGAIFLFDVDTYTPMELWISFRPNLIPMWPAGLGGQYTRWLDELNAYYIGEGSKNYVGIIGSPFAKKMSTTPGHHLPDEPMKFVIPVSQKLSVESYIPIIITGGIEGKDKAVRQFINLLNSVPENYQYNCDHFQQLRSDFMTITTPEPELNLAFEWAKVSLDKGLVDNPQLGQGLVAGYGGSGKTQRPGFAWFFGSDTSLNSLAINCYGDFKTTRQALTMLRDNQRQDGKIFHELTQSAALLNWFEDYPYGFYHAETSAFYIVAMHDYLIRSGDKDFIRESWNSIKMAYHYCLTADKDHDGLMENSAAGLAAMEVGDMLKQNRVDIYLAAIWLQALRCMIKLSEIFNERVLRKKCQQQFEKAHQSFLNIFVDNDSKQLNFALLTDGNKHTEQTVWQSIPLFFNLIDPELVESTLLQFASAEMSSDWGVRGVARKSHYYDPISYNNGSVWPFTTGYVATAQYKHHRAINGFHNLMANARLTWLDALGWHTELLSGEYCRPVSTSVPHQLFSATGIINPLVLGLLGLESNAISRKITFAPHLPMDWDELNVENYQCNGNWFDLHIKRSINKLLLQVTHRGQEPYRFSFSPAFALGTKIDSVFMNQQEHDFNLTNTPYDVHCCIDSELDRTLTIEIQYLQGIELSVPLPEISIGKRATGIKVIDCELKGKIYKITVEGLPGHEYHIYIKTGFSIQRVAGAEIMQIDNQWHKLKMDFELKKSNKYVKRIIRLYF